MDHMTISVRPETAADHSAIREVNTLAFGQPGEAILVDTLRGACPDAISLVAVVNGAVVGHVLLTPVTIGTGTRGGYGLGPVAVLPARQRQGIGSALIREGLRRLDASGCPFIVVLGHREYYPRFGFASAKAFGIFCKWDPAGEHFMIRFANPAVPPSISGLVHYHPAFDAVT